MFRKGRYYLRVKEQNIENYMVLNEVRTPHEELAAMLDGMATPLRTRTAAGISRPQAERAAYAATERRLYALPIIRARVEDSREELCELENLGIEALRDHSSSLIRLIRPGMRLEPEEVHAAQMSTLRARLAADERELKKLNIALECVRRDHYFPIIEMKYFQNRSELEIAGRLKCDTSTVGRNRRRLVKTLSLRLYGV